MKRLFFIPLAAFMLCSCSSPIAVPVRKPDIDMSFCAKAHISYHGTGCTARMSRIEEGKWEFCVTEPYALEGLIVTVDGDSTKLSMFGMESAADVLPEAVSAAGIISSAFDEAAQASSQAVNTDGVTTLSGQSRFGGYTMTFDNELRPISLGVESRALTVELSDFSELSRDIPDAVVE